MDASAVEERRRVFRPARRTAARAAVHAASSSASAQAAVSRLCRFLSVFLRFSTRGSRGVVAVVRDEDGVFYAGQRRERVDEISRAVRQAHLVVQLDAPGRNALALERKRLDARGGEVARRALRRLVRAVDDEDVRALLVRAGLRKRA